MAGLILLLIIILFLLAVAVIKMLPEDPPPPPPPKRDLITFFNEECRPFSDSGLNKTKQFDQQEVGYE